MTKQQQAIKKVHQNNKRVTPQQKNEIVLDIVKRVLSMQITNEIITQTSVQYGLSESSMWKYHKMARDIITNRPLESTQELISHHIAIREDIYRNSEHSRDKLQAVESIAKLQGLDIKRIEVINNSKYDTIEDSTILEALIDDDDA